MVLMDSSTVINILVNRLTVCLPLVCRYYRFPKRTFDVGIAEQHAMTFAAGLAVEGIKPFAAIYSTFMQVSV